MATKTDWIVRSNDGDVLCNDFGRPEEFRSERAAIRRAERWLFTQPPETEAWVYRLSHIVSVPRAKIEVEAVKG